MLKVWGKIWHKHRVQESYTATDDHQDWTEEARLEVCIDEIIQALDLPRPIWLKQNRDEIQQFGRTQFHQDHFMESFPYQSFEVEIIGTDDDEEEAMN